MKKIVAFILSNWKTGVIVVFMIFVTYQIIQIEKRISTIESDVSSIESDVSSLLYC